MHQKLLKCVSALRAVLRADVGGFSQSLLPHLYRSYTHIFVMLQVSLHRELLKCVSVLTLFRADVRGVSQSLVPRLLRSGTCVVVAPGDDAPRVAEVCVCTADGVGGGRRGLQLVSSPSTM